MFIIKRNKISSFDTNNVINMNKMFHGCSSLKEINLSNFNNDDEPYMRGMFFGCSNEIKIKIKEQIKNIKEEAFINE